LRGAFPADWFVVVFYLGPAAAQNANGTGWRKEQDFRAGILVFRLFEPAGFGGGEQNDV
jgi:hypothetical protein